MAIWVKVFRFIAKTKPFSVSIVVVGISDFLQQHPTGTMHQAAGRQYCPNKTEIFWTHIAHMCICMRVCVHIECLKFLKKLLKFQNCMCVCAYTQILE